MQIFSLSNQFILQISCQNGSNRQLKSGTLLGPSLFVYIQSFSIHISHRGQLFLTEDNYFSSFSHDILGFVVNPPTRAKITKPESIIDAARARECDFDVFISYAPPSGGLRLAKERKSQVRQPMGFHITSGYRKVHPTFRSASGCAKEERKLLIPNNC